MSLHIDFNVLCLTGNHFIVTCLPFSPKNTFPKPTVFAQTLQKERCTAVCFFYPISSPSFLFILTVFTFHEKEFSKDAFRNLFFFLSESFNHLSDAGIHHNLSQTSPLLAVFGAAETFRVPFFFFFLSVCNGNMKEYYNHRCLLIGSFLTLCLREELTGFTKPA